MRARLDAAREKDFFGAKIKLNGVTGVVLANDNRDHMPALAERVICDLQSGRGISLQGSRFSPCTTPVRAAEIGVQ